LPTVFREKTRNRRLHGHSTRSSRSVSAITKSTIRHRTLAFGLIAEEVAEVVPDLVGGNRDGEPESVRYDQINAMLLNEFIKEHRKVEQQEAAIIHLRQNFQSKLAEQQQKIEALTVGLAKVTAQLQAGSSAPQVVAKSP
jgi:hypothetical protein